MAYFLILTENGINTRPVRADTGAELFAALRAELQGEPIKAAAIELLTVADLAADGTVPQGFIDAQTNRAALVAKAEAALAANATFLALPVPIVAPTLAQVQALWTHTQNVTKECSTLIRLLLGQLDTTAGT